MSDLQWIPAAKQSDLIAESGIAVWTPAGPVAIFYLPGSARPLYAIGHYDPIGKANVLARGIIGDIKGELVVASPLYKQHYSLTTGQCLEDETVSVPAFEVQLEGDDIKLGIKVRQIEECAA
ncbi:nitrite reductase small subunit NirD [Marinobacter sp. 1Y8]